MSSTSFAFRNLIYYPMARYQAGPVRRYKTVLESTQFQDRQRLLQLQAERLRALLAHARSHVPYYVDRLPSPPMSDEPFEMLGALPYLRKSELQAFPAELRSAAPLGRLTPKTTGGSTGEPVSIWKTRDAWAWELAATWRGYGWAGVEVGDLQARFWGVPQQAGARFRARLIDAVCHRIRIPAFSFSERDMARYQVVLKRRRPAYFYGYVSMLTEFARYLRSSGQSLSYAPRAVITTSEVLDSTDRELLRDTFGAPVYNEYGCGELGTIAHECPDGCLHLNEENMVVEVCADDRRCLPGESGEIVVTELNNLAVPLVRYRTGDYGFIRPEPCSCGRSLAVLGGVHGRAYDFVRNRQGQMFHGEFIMYIFEDLRRRNLGVKQFQVEQTDLDRFVVRIVRATDYDVSCEAVITARIREHVDSGAAVVFEYPDSFEREASGKLRVVKGLGAPASHNGWGH